MNEGTATPARAASSNGVIFEADGVVKRFGGIRAVNGASLSVGEGVNPLGDEALGMLPEWWASHPCTELVEDT